MNHRPRKRFGQNFLHDEFTIDAIISALQLHKTDKVVEIGPGMGALTCPLLKCLEQLIAIEIDRDLQDYLRHLAPAAQLKLIAADALTVDYSQWGKHLRIVGNLPYNIASALLLRLLTFKHSIKDMLFMVQKEVAQRLAAQPGCKAYGRLSVMVQYHCAVDYLFDVPPTAFTPQPKVDSAILRLTPHLTSLHPEVALDKLERLVAQAFSMRRKTLFNNLKSIVTRSDLVDLMIDPEARPEQISVSNYARIAKWITYEY